MSTITEIKNAIARSESHNDIVRVSVGMKNKYYVTTTDDRKMGNPDQAIEAATPAEAAAQFTVRACDYYTDKDAAADAVGTPVTKIVTDEEGNETRFEAEYE